MYLECRLFLSYHTMPRNNTSRMNLTHNNTLSHTASVGLGEDYNASTLIWVDNIIISLLFYCM